MVKVKHYLLPGDEYTIIDIAFFYDAPDKKAGKILGLPAGNGILALMDFQDSLINLINQTK